MAAPTIQMNNGLSIPVFGLGTWQASPGEVGAAVSTALSLGYRHIDCAHFYGNEPEIGSAIRSAIASNVVSREDLFITSKLWNNCHRPDLVVPACKRSLQDFGIEYLDLYLVHWPFAYKEEAELTPLDRDGNAVGSDVDFVDTWKAMEKCVEMGLVRSIGLSNFNTQQIGRVLEVAKIKPVTNQASPGEIGLVVSIALSLGYRHIDCAHFYGNEPEIGSAIRSAIASNVVSREDLFITSKLWNNCHRPDLVVPACKRSLQDFGLEYLDLYLVHWPFAYKEEAELTPLGRDGNAVGSDVDFVDTWKAMEKCVEMGLVRSIGLSNFNTQQIGRVLEVAKIKPVTNQASAGKVDLEVSIVLSLGYRHIDCAHFYGNEPEIGLAIANNVVSREDLFITSKLWNNCHRPDLVVPACKRSLQDFGLEYLDLYLVHWPFAYKEEAELTPLGRDGNAVGSDVDFVDTWKAMEKCVEMGLVRSIGLSNFNTRQIERVLEVGKIKPVTNQVEVHPYMTNKPLIQFCSERDITITSYFPLGSPARPWARPEEPVLLEDPQIGALGKKYSKTPAQIILRYLIQIGTIPVPKSSNPKRLKENIEIFDFELNEDDVKVMDGFNRNFRINLIENSKHLKEYPFNIEY